MSITLSTPVTGATQTGFTSPTYTIVADTPPSVNSKQYAVTALGGTQTGVDIHSVSKPFTVTFFRPAALKALPAPNPVTGIIKDIPVNTYKVITRKGAVPYANQATKVARITTVIDIPVGTDTYEPEEIRAMLSLHAGAINQVSAGLGDTLTNGLL